MVVDRLSLSDRINQLHDRLLRETTFTFQSCFAFVTSGELAPAELREQVVVTFLAILEMARLKLLRIAQAEPQADIQIMRVLTELPPIPTSADSVPVEDTDGLPQETGSES